ncbi:MAG: C_GCAxxG_C_C family protein [Clostridia bacterium]|nr:C_GCAxxG_C_C family protein [Clostridia bacterium]
MTKKELGISYFKKGYNCAQAVILAFSDKLGVSEDVAVKLISGFGGGFGRMREVCGAVSGMVAVLSAAHGYANPEDNAGKMALYQTIQGLMNKFKEENGSYICGELLSLPNGASSPIPEARTNEYYKKRPCAELVGSACEILENYFNA